jgi:hypothetical protein
MWWEKKEGNKETKNKYTIGMILLFRKPSLPTHLLCPRCLV